MNKAIIFAVAMLMAPAGGSAFALDQTRPQPMAGPEPSPGPRPDGPGRDQRADEGPGARSGPAWERHVRACQRRYRTYNPRTDMFVARPGVMRRCRL